MVRKYIRKTERAKKYSKNELNIALSEIRSGRLNIRGAVAKFHIPFSTLQNHISGVRGKKSNSLGRGSVFSPEDERKLADGIKTMAKWGWGLSRKEILQLVGSYVNSNNMKTPFKNGIPGKDWFIGFKKRHRLSLKKAESLEYTRKKASCDPFVMEGYFDLLKSTLDELDLYNKPRQIYNLDETYFPLDPSKTKVVGETNMPVSRVTSGPGRENTTVLAVANANGEKLPPFIVYKGKFMWNSWIAPEDRAYPGISYAASSNGWMETDIFNNYFEKVFLTKCCNERPILLIYDGHSTHLDLKFLNMAKDNDVTVLKLPPHTSHMLQPLDLCVFKSLKSRWDEKLSAFQRKNMGSKVCKSEFASLLSDVWRETSKEVIVSGFRKGGIYPFDRSVIKHCKFDPAVLKRYEESKTQSSGSPNKKTRPIMVSPSKPSPRKCSSTPTKAVDQQPTTSAAARLSFEELLLSAVKQQPRPEKASRKRIAPGAQIVTSKDYIRQQILLGLKKEKETSKPPKKYTKLKIKKEKYKQEDSKDDKKVNTSKSNKPVGLGLKKKNFRKKQPWDRPTSSEEDEIMSLCNSDSDLGCTTLDSFTEYIKEKQKQEEREIKESMTTPDELKVRDWVLTKFETKKKVLHYVGQIIEATDMFEVCVMFVRKNTESLSSTVFKWPLEPDTSMTLKNDIIRVLPQPTVGRRGELIFEVSFASFNVQ